MEIILKPVGIVHNSRVQPDDDNWGEVVSEIFLEPHLPPESLQGINEFSHLEILFYFNSLPDSKIVSGARHPRDNQKWPLTGIFAQRGAGRPNKLGATIVEFVELKDRVLLVRGLDAIHGTPVLDIKPVFREFLPRTEIHQPLWTLELMKNYWKLPG